MARIALAVIALSFLYRWGVGEIQSWFWGMRNEYAPQLTVVLLLGLVAYWYFAYKYGTGSGQPKNPYKQ
jgi:hypothetical protein